LLLLPLLLLSSCGTGRRIPPLDVTVAPGPKGRSHPVFTNLPPADVSLLPPNSVPLRSPDLSAANTASIPATNHVTQPQTYPHPLAVVETWVNLDQWCRGNSLGPLQRIPVQGQTAYSFATPRGHVVLTVGSTLASLDGMQFHFGYSPLLINGSPYIHHLDIGKNLTALLSGNQIFCTNRSIVIDAGHGGKDKGAQNVFNGASEKDFTLDWALRLQALLVTNGWKVWLTRTNDQYLSLGERVLFAEEHRPDLFLSLHFNISPHDQEPAGLETFCCTPTGLPSTETRGNIDNIYLSFPNNQFDIENMQFAGRLHRAILKINGNTDRGLRHARFLTVLREQHRPAVLIEGGFLSNPAEARRIADPEYRQQLAEAAAAALCESNGPLQTASSRLASPATAHP
jgi:N-acetylmuramoyl-L-alanine amidase